MYVIAIRMDDQASFVLKSFTYSSEDLEGYIDYVVTLSNNRLDYCNALLYGVSDRLICRLQSVQNAAARLVTGARRCDYITPILRQLHWLPVRQRVLLKIAVLVFQCLTGQAPSYLSDDCQPVSDSRPRRFRVIRFNVVCRSTCTQHVW